jgi:hypothetical protein
MTPIDRRRRAVLYLLGLVPWLGHRAVAQGTARVEGGTPHLLPHSAIDDLGIDEPALVNDEPAELAVLNLGAIALPSGRIAGVDGLLLDGEPYAPAVAPGSYPLQVVLARLSGGEERVAFMQLKLADRAAVAWSNAMFDGEDASALDDEEISAFTVESGIAALFDAGALESWRSELAHNAGLMRELEQVLRENRRPVWTWARIRAGGGSGILVTAGLGEGEYGAYWGKDSDGAIVSLVLDFDLIDWDGLPVEEPVTI